MSRRSDGTVRSVALWSDSARIGSARDNEVILEGKDVAPLHARIKVDDEVAWIEDAGSPFGTWINGERITARRPLRHLDVITVGKGIDVVALLNDVAGSPTRAIVARPIRAPEGLDELTMAPTTRRNVVGKKTDRRVFRLAGPSGDHEGGPGVYTIGRGVDVAFYIDSKQVSRRHAKVTVTPEGASIEDLDSANGTVVNGKLISGRTPLRDGDTVSFSDLVFRVEM